MGNFKKENRMILKKIADKIEKTNLAYLFTVLVISGFLIYFFSLFNGFVWDDEEQIVNNAVIQNIFNLPYLFTSSTFNTGGAGLSGWYYKPLMPISFSFINFVFGLNPFFYHLFDLLLHFLNGVLIFLFLKKIFDFSKYKFSKTVSFLLSLLFIVHPVNVESVAYVSSTQELLYVLFMLLALLATHDLLTQEKKSWKRLLLLNFLILFSLLSKESGIVTIPLIILFAFVINKLKIKILLISSFSTFIFYLILRFPIAKTPFLQHSQIIPISNASLFQRFLTIPFEIFSYVRLIFFPLNLFVAQHTVVKTVSEPRFYLSFLFLAVSFFVLVLIFRKFWSKNIIFFIGWIIFTFTLLLNIYPLDMTIAERWMYGPLIGVLGLIGLLFLEMTKKNTKYLSIFILAAILFSLVFFVRSFIRTFDWKNDLSLFSHDVKYSSSSFDLQNNLGVAFFREGKIIQSEPYFKKSIELSPKWWTPYNNLGVIYQRQGKIKEAKTMYQKSIANGSYYLAYENLAQLRASTEDPKQVIPFIEDSLKTLPKNEILNKVAAFLYAKTGESQKAKFYATKTYQLNQSQANYLFLQSILNEK